MGPHYEVALRLQEQRMEEIRRQRADQDPQGTRIGDLALAAAVLFIGAIIADALISTPAPGATEVQVAADYSSRP